MIDWNIVAAIATALSGLATFATVLAVWFTLHADHARSRRQFTVQLMQYWIEQNAPNRQLRRNLRELMEHLTHKQCVAIYHEQAVDIETARRPQLDVIFAEQPERPTISDGMIRLNADASRLLRDVTLLMLNEYESIAAAFVSDICDHGLIKSEFGPVLYGRGSKPIFENFVDATGIYPSLRKMYKELNPLREQFLRHQNSRLPGSLFNS